MKGEDVYVVEYRRTPFGRVGGALAAVRPDDLAALVIRALVDSLASATGSSATDVAGLVDEVTLGSANQAGEDNRNLARMAALLAGLPATVTGSTTNRLCASGLDAVVQASRMIKVGDAGLVLAGGAESMSRAPWVVQKPERAFPTGPEQMWSTTLGWRMTNPRMRPEWTVSLGEATELLAAKYGIDRAAADEFAERSHRLAAAAWASGAIGPEIVQVPDHELLRDEAIRDGVTVERLSALKPVFRPDGQVTAGNASPMNDGAAALALADARTIDRLGAQPLARVVAAASYAVEPQFFGIAPVEAVRKAVSRGGRTLGELHVIELNEAFAAQALACVGEWGSVDTDVVNPDGGALAIGHPLGASGARLVGSVARRLAGRPGEAGVAALCIGVGQGQALVLEGV